MLQETFPAAVAAGQGGPKAKYPLLRSKSSPTLFAPMYCEWLGAWSCITLVFLTIGIPTITLGCDSYYPSCIAYIPIVQTVRNATIKTGSITICSGSSGVLVCAPLRDGYLQVTFDQCTFETAGYSVSDFPIGASVSLLKSKTDASKCELPNVLPRNLGITGIVFTSLAGISLLVILVGSVWLWRVKHLRIQALLPAVPCEHVAVNVTV